MIVCAHNIVRLSHVRHSASYAASLAHRCIEKGTHHHSLIEVMEGRWPSKEVKTALSFPAQSTCVCSPFQSIIQQQSQAFVYLYKPYTVTFYSHRFQLKPGPPKVHQYLPGLGGVNVQAVYV